MKRLSTFLLALVLTACNLPRPIPPTQPETPTATPGQCAFVEGRKSLPELSARYFESLKSAGLPVDAARAEAYGENCVDANGTVIRFAARETDFYTTLSVTDLSDEETLGRLLEQILVVIADIPADQIGPNPGFIGVTFKVGDQVQNLWFTQSQATDLQKQGVKGADLYRSLKNNP